MRSRFWVISRYELKQYRNSFADEAIIFLLILSTFLMLMTPQVEQSMLPSSYKIYRVGYTIDSPMKSVESYSIDLTPYIDKYQMMQDSNVGLIDAFAIDGRNEIVFFSSGTNKANSALAKVDSTMREKNIDLIFDYVDRNPEIAPILFPLRLLINETEINYTQAINGSINLKRNDILKTNRVGEQKEIEKLSGDVVEEDIIISDDAPKQTFGVEDYSLPLEFDVAFPFKTLYKNMTLISPLIMLSILLSLSLSKERVNRNIDNLFNSPLTPTEILLGKSAPYLIAMTLLSIVYGVYAIQNLDALKVAFIFISLSSAMVSFSLFSTVVSRSYRELTFIGSFSLFSFFFFIVLPNVFSGVNVLAFISPLDTITSIENGAEVSLSDVIFSLLPYWFLTMFFLVFTKISFTSEILYDTRSIWDLFKNFYITLAKHLKSDVKYVIVSVSLLVPFIFIIESILAYLVLPMGFFAPILSLILLAFVEEITKIIPFLYKKVNPIVYGVVAGVSFFACEKLFNLYLISKVYSILGGPYQYFLARFAPTLALHIISTTVFAVIIHRSKRPSWFILGLFISVITHVLYNVAVLRGLI